MRGIYHTRIFAIPLYPLRLNISKHNRWSIYWKEMKQHFHILMFLLNAIFFLFLTDSSSAQTTEQLMQQAVSQYKSGQLDKAISSLHQAIKLDSSSADPYVLLGQIHLEKKRTKDAESILLRAARLKLNDARIYFLLGASQFEQAKYSDAIINLKRAVELNPNSPAANKKTKEVLSFAYLNLGAKEYQSGRKTQARQYIESAVKTDPSNVKAYRNLAIVYYESGKKSEATDALQKGLKIDPRDEAMLKMLVQIHSQQKDFKSAQNVCEKIHSYYPKDLDVALQLAYLYRFNNEVDKAIKIYQKFIQLNPTEKKVYDEYADLFFSLGQPDSAISVYQNLLKQTPDNKSIYNDIAQIYAEQKRWDEARFAYRMTMQGQNTHPQLYQRIAETYLSESRNDEAVTILQEALSHFPNNEDFLRTLGMIYEKTQPLLAITTYNLIMKGDSLNPYPYVRLGIVFEKLDSLDEAMNHFRKAIDLRSTHPTSYHFLAIYSMKKNDTSQALSYEYEAVSYSYDQIRNLKNKLFSALGSANRNQKALFSDSTKQQSDELKTTQEQLHQALANLLLWEKADALEHYFQDRLEKHPDESEIIESLAHLYENNDAHEKALKTYQRLIQSDIKNKSGHLGLARLFEKSGKESDAIQSYKRALTIDTKDSTIYQSLIALYERQGNLSEMVDDWMVRSKTESSNVVLLKNLLFILQKQKMEREAASIKALIDKIQSD